MSSGKKTQIGDYLLNEEIGSGGFAKVVLGTHIPTGEKVAIKIMDKKQILSDELNKERVLSEISILKIVRHNNIIKLYEMMETPQKIYLVMEYCDGGELFDYIVSKQHLSEKQACVFFQEIIDALTYLHSQNIVHRDVKPENILLESFGKTMTCKLIDFGISRTYTLDKLISTPCGTASYAPPEMHRGEEYYGLLSDVWSAGVLLYAMVFGYLPFCEEDEDTNIDNIIKGNYEIPEEASPQLSDFLTHILDIDPLTRYDLDQIKKHPWYNIVSPPKALPGIIIGYHKIPIDERILNVCEAYGFDKNAVKKSVSENKYDNKSSIYYIILNKMKREGYDSIADLFSNDYLEYIKNPGNLIQKKEKKDKKDNDKKEEEKKKDLTSLEDVIKPKDENKKDNTNKELINPELDQISIDNKLKPNKSEAEISVASESSKKAKKDESINSSPKINNDKDDSSPKLSNNVSKISSPQRNDSVSSKNSSKKNTEININTSSPKKNEEIEKNENKDSLQKINNIENENEKKEEIKAEQPLATLEQKIIEEPKDKIDVNVNKEEENKDINKEEINEKPVIEEKKEEIEIKLPEIKIEIEKPVIITPKKEEKEENVENNEIPKEEEKINPILDQIIKGENKEETEKIEKESEKETEKEPEKENEKEPEKETEKELEKEQEKETEKLEKEPEKETEKLEKEPEKEKEKETKKEIVKEPEKEPEKEKIITAEIQTPIKKEEENISLTPISYKNENEQENKNEPLITLEEKINQEKEIIIENKVENKEENKVEKKEENKVAKENKKEIKIEQISKTDNKLQPEISISNRPKDPKLSYSLMPKHSFMINSNTKKMLSFNVEENDNDKLNTSFTMKLTDSLKENVLKMKNPKMKNPNKEKEINKALHEIKQKKGGVSNAKQKKHAIPKPKNKKNIKISNEPLFKDNKRDHTIIHNRNASAASNARKNNNEGQEKNRKKKDISTSMAKIERKNINNANNVDLKNTMKKVKKDTSKDTNKEKKKEKRNESIAKKRNINIVKKISKEENNKKSSINLKKNIPKPFPSTIKKKDNTSSSYALNTKSNTNPPKKNVSTQKKIELKTPNKNLDKTHFEPIYHKLDNTNTTKSSTSITKNENQRGILNKTIQLSDVKKTNKKSKIPYDKNSNKKFNKNIRLNFKNIEEEDIIPNDINKINYIKKTPEQMNKTFNGNSIRNLRNETKEKDKEKDNVIKKRKVNHNKSNSMRGNLDYNHNKEHIYIHNNENVMSYRNINNYKKNQEGNNNAKNNRYQSAIRTERNDGKTKKFLDLWAYEGTKTESAVGKNRNLKFLNNDKKQKNSYYGPIDIRNIVVGKSPNEVNERINDILIRNRVKCWKLNPWKFYCNKNGEIFVVEIFLLPNKIIINNDKNEENKGEENEVKEFDIHSKNESMEENNDNNKKNNNKTKKIYYITVLSKDSSNKTQAKNINKIINKRFKEMKNK